MAENENIKLEEELSSEVEAEEVEVTEETDAKDKEIEVLRDKLLRVSAEYDNFRKRTQKEKDALYKNAKADTVATFLPLLDNMEKAVNTLPENAEGEWKAVSEGIALIKKQLDEILKKLGVTEIEALGKQFDPELHNAVMHVEDEEQEENIVVEEFQRGFKIDDKVVRHSVVKVAN